MSNYPKKPAFALITLVLPGPDRKRQPVPYHFRITFRSPTSTEPGCVATWEIYGGREEYQLSLERTHGSELIWHCTCPDAVYRADDKNPTPHYCKHVRALRELFDLVTPPPINTPEAQEAVQGAPACAPITPEPLRPAA